MFGSTAAIKPFGFGTPTGSAATQSTPATGAFGAFSTPSATASTSTPFSFGSKPAAATTSLFGSSTPAAQQSPFGGFGTPQNTTTTPFGQSMTATSTGTSLFNFGAGAASTTTTTTSQPATSGFSFSFGGTGSTPLTSASTGFGGFGATTTTASTSSGFGGFGQPAQPQANTSLFGLGQQPQVQQIGSTTLNTTNVAANSTNDNLMNSLVYAQIFNDERDLILAKWNQLQAFYGTGKIFYQNMVIDVQEDNRLTRFKTIGYSCKPSTKNEDGLVCLLINGLQETIKTNQKTITDCLSKIFGSNQALTITVESIKSLVNDKTELTFYIVERSPTGQTRRVPSLDVFSHMNKQEAPSMLSSLQTNTSVKKQLEQINVISVYPLVGLNDEQIKQYLDVPPQNINPILWEQAKRNNPNPKKLLPVPIVGFKEINKRFVLQEQENQAQKNRLGVIARDIESINLKSKLLQTKIDQYKSKNEDLEYRVLKVMINYEIRRKIGYNFQENERYLRSVLESLQIELNAPINREIQKQKINEFLDIIKTYEAKQQQHVQSNETSQYKQTTLANMDSIETMQKLLRDEHKALKSLIEIINNDVNDLAMLKRDMQL